MLRKIINAAVLFFILLPLALFAELGDANGDNIIDILDALVVAQHYVGNDPRPYLGVNCDVSGDGRINVIDALQIAQFYVGILSEFRVTGIELPVFASEKDFIAAFENTRNVYPGYWRGPFTGDMWFTSDGTAAPVPVIKSNAEGGTGSADYSTTTVQVEGVDEADIIKNDGNFIYMLANGELIIADGYPASEAAIYSRTPLKGMTPLEMFINGNTLLVFGRSQFGFTDIPVVPIKEPVAVEPIDPAVPSVAPLVDSRAYYYPSYTSFVTVKLFDISSRRIPRVIKQVNIEGSYLSSRKIGDYVYFVINSPPHYYIDRPIWQEIVPMFRETGVESDPTLAEMIPVAPFDKIGYIEPIQAQQFITVAALSMSDPVAPVKRQTIIGSGNEIFASLENLYIAQRSWSLYTPGTTDMLRSYTEKTYLTKFAIADGTIKFVATGSVKGHILNQFSMDEFDNHFRIATTFNDVWSANSPSTNNVYIMNGKMRHTGRIEGLAPGEKIYSVRFMGKKGYMVTFVSVDPLFVLDLSDHSNPAVLGELKIPGYSDYMHPYDENHIIGLGKEATGGNEYFSWYQGVKLALFDVTDVKNPVLMFNETIGHRGTDSEALHEHKAFLFDREKNLLCIPITLAEIEGEPTSDSQRGVVTFQGALVYNLDLEKGFDLKGRLTHHDDFDALMEKGYYFGRDSAIRRSLYIDNILYTFSQIRLQGNDMGTLRQVLALDLHDNGQLP